MTEAVLIRPHLQPVPLAAVALAILLHLGIGTALWWIAPDKPIDLRDEPIMLMFDTAPSDVGLQQPERVGPPPESVPANTKRPSVPGTNASPEALATLQPAPDPPPTLPLFEFSIPPVAEPPPAPTSRDFARPAQPPRRPAQRLSILPPQPSAPQRPPTELPAAMPSPVPGAQPADVLAGQGRQRNDYLSRVFRHLEPYRFDPAKDKQHGRVVTRVTVARDGRVLEVSLASSSGSAALDAAEVAAIRKGSPFPPLPAAMPGDPVILVLPITY